MIQQCCIFVYYNNSYINPPAKYEIGIIFHYDMFFKTPVSIGPLVSVCGCPSICLSVCLFVCPSVGLSVFCLTVCLPVYLSFCLSFNTSVCLYLCLLFSYLPTSLSIQPSDCLSVCLFICLYVQSVYLSDCLRLSVCLSIFCLSACSDEGLTLETSAKHYIPQAKNIPCQPLLIKPEICPEMHAIVNIANIADIQQKSQISQNYSSERLRTSQLSECFIGTILNSRKRQSLDENQI